MRASFFAPLVVAPLVVAPLAVLSSCDEPVPENNSCDGAWFEPFLAAETDSTADLSCAEALSAEPAFAASCQARAALAGRAVDHQSRDPIVGASVEVHESNDLDASPDWSATSGELGVIEHDVPLCTPIAYQNDRGDGNARVTTGQHVIIAPDDAGDVAFDFRSVGNGTLSLITLILGDELDDANGFIFGKVVGCDGEIAVDKVQALVRDENCSVPSTYSPGYTTNETPDAFARATTDDGFFFVSNIPPGTWTLEGYVRDGESFRLVASAPIVVRASQVSLVDLQIGRSDGVRLKAGCTSGC
jgi:hypothetical protein